MSERTIATSLYDFAEGPGLIIGGKKIQDGMGVIATASDGTRFTAVIGAINCQDPANTRVRLAAPGAGVTRAGSRMLGPWIPFAEKPGTPGTWSWPS